MPEDEKKKRIGSVREFFPNFSKDYAIDLLRSFQWDVEAALSMATTELLPSYLRHCDPSTYIHNPDDFLQPPPSQFGDMMQRSGNDTKATDDYRSAMMSIQGTAIKPKCTPEGFIGPMPVIRTPLLYFISITAAAAAALKFCCCLLSALAVSAVC